MHQSYAAATENEMSNIEIAYDIAKVRRYRAIKDHLFSDLAGEAVILSLKNGKYYGVNHVGAAIWSAIQQKSSLAEIETVLMQEYEVDEETCRSEVKSFLDNMIQEELVDVLDE